MNHDGALLEFVRSRLIHVVYVAEEYPCLCCYISLIRTLYFIDYCDCQYNETFILYVCVLFCLFCLFVSVAARISFVFRFLFSSLYINYVKLKITKN